MRIPLRVKVLAIATTIATLGGVVATGYRIEWWILVPALALVVLNAGVASNKPEQVLIASGMLVGFSLLTLWSAGRYFLPAAGCALTMFTMNVLVDTGAKVRQVLWFFWGVFAVFAINAAWLKLSERGTFGGQFVERNQLSPVVSYGALFFLALSAVLLLTKKMVIKKAAE